MPRFSVAVGLGLALMMACTVGARADDGWNPFKERDQARQRERAARERREQRNQDGDMDPLPPMGGVSSESWDNGAAPGAGQSAGYANPGYPAPPGQPAPWADPPPGRPGAPETGAAPTSVQRYELQPLAPIPGESAPGPETRPASSGPVAPAQSLDPTFWQGVDLAGLGEMITPLKLPPRSEALAGLWRRLIEARTGPAAGSAARQGPGHAPTYEAVRIEALYRSGLVADLRAMAAARKPDPKDAMDGLVLARTRISFGDQATGCPLVKELQREQARLPKSARNEFLVLAALCGVGEGDPTKAGLAAELLRAEAVPEPIALAALDALASGNPKSFKMSAAKSLSLIEYRFLDLVGAEPPLEGAEPALLTVVATTAKEPSTRILAAEAALALHTIRPEELAEAYRSASFSESALAHPLSEPQPPPLRRALLFKALESERTPTRKAQLARALLDEIRRSQGPYAQVAGLLAPAIADLRPGAELAWFTGTAIEINLAAHRIDAMRAWAGPQGRFDDWMALADIASSRWSGRRGENLRAVERLALDGKLAPELMHKLVTVLDALDYQIPIPLWEAASRTPQPNTGFLPETGVLSRLQEASKRREQARVVLLAIRAFGPETAETAHMIALGDTIRALRRAGFEHEARRLGLEALFMPWPRGNHG